jgi:hypothetical protein
MQPQLCSEIKRLVAEYLIGNLDASPSIGNGCTVTLPVKTVDDRWVFVIVESKFDYFAVHDAGKTDSALFSEGLKMSDTDEQFNAAIASKYGVTVDNGIIQATCRRDKLSETIAAVAQASSVMTALLVSSRLVEAEAQEVHGRVSEALRLWKPEDVIIQENVSIETGVLDTRVDFVARAGASARRSAAIKILPTSHPKGRAERYGFMRHEMRNNAEYNQWANLAVVLGAETWSEPALRIVKRFADHTIEVSSDREDEVEARIPTLMTALTTQERVDLKL